MENGNQPAFARFLNMVANADGCWVWGGGISSTGYGVFWMEGKNRNSHTVAYEFFVGEIGDWWVLHTCDNKACVNPEHLYLGSHADNTKDAVERGRMATGDKHGSKTSNRDFSFDKNPNKGISKENCIAIRAAILGGVKPAWIASQINVNLSTVYRAKYKADALIAELNRDKI